MVSWLCFALVVATLIVDVAAFGALGSGALRLVLLFDVVAAVGIAALGAALRDRAESRRHRTGYVICEADYADAPHHIKSAMRRIFKSARAVRGGSAYQTGMFGDLELDRLVYSAAERAVISSELCAGVRDLGEAQDGELFDTAEQLADIRRYVREVEAALKRAAKTACRLSTSLSDCAKALATQQAAQRAAEAAADRGRLARTRIEQATARDRTATRVAAGDLEDRVSATYEGYREATKISDEVLYGPTPQTRDRDADNWPPTLEAVWEAAKFTATTVGTASVAAANWGTDRIKAWSTSG